MLGDQCDIIFIGRGWKPMQIWSNKIDVLEIHVLEMCSDGKIKRRDPSEPFSSVGDSFEIKMWFTFIYFLKIFFFDLDHF